MSMGPRLPCPGLSHEAGSPGKTRGNMGMYGIEYFPGILRRTVLSLTGETTLGRSKSNTLTISRPGVSRYHAKITPRNGGWVLEDLHSKNGSFVNGKCVSSQTLSPGDWIRLGSANLRFVELGKGPARDPGADLLASTMAMDEAEPLGTGSRWEITHQMHLVRTFLQAVKVGVLIVTPDMQALYYNASLEPCCPDGAEPPVPLGLVLGCSHAASRGCYPGSCHECALCSFVGEAFDCGSPAGPLEVSWPPRGAVLRSLRFWASPLPYHLMGERLCLLTWEDVTQARTIEAKLEELNTDLEDANRQLTAAIEKANVLAFQAEAANIAKSAFLARMSHEIRTPLNSVLGYTEILLEEDLKEEQKTYVRLVHRSGQALLALIEDILDFSKIEAGEMRLESVSFPIRELLLEACEIVRPRLQGKQVELSCLVAPDVPELLFGDPVRTRQVVLNLLSNAAKFTNKGEISLQVELSGKQGPALQLLFSVKDTGIGIPPHKLRIIFEPFRQAEDSTSRLHGGTGLGLTICKQLARLMGGDVWVASKEGTGSTFFFKAWFQQAPQPALEEKHQGDAPTSTGTQMTQPEVAPLSCENPRPARILLVEDNPVNANLAKLMLTRAGHSVQTARDGWEALKLFTARSKEFDMIFMDVEMPGMDGLRTTRRIRSLGHGDVPIVAMTAHALKEDMQKCLDSGMNDYLSKPIRKDLLLQMVSKWAPAGGDGNGP